MGGGTNGVMVARGIAANLAADPIRIARRPSSGVVRSSQGLRTAMTKAPLGTTVPCSIE